MKKIHALHAGDGNGPQRPSLRHVADVVRHVYRQENTTEFDTLDEIIEHLEANGEKPLYWDGFSYDGLRDEAAAHTIKRKNLAEYLRKIATRLDGRRVRLFQCVTWTDEIPTGHYFTRGKHKGEQKIQKIRHQKWVDIADLLIARTRPSDDRWADMKSRIGLRDELNYALNTLVELQHGISVKIAGIEGVITLVGEGFVFQPSMFGFTNETDVA